MSHAVTNLPALVPTSRVALLGFGALARAFAGMVAPRGVALAAWDAGLTGRDAPGMRARIEAAGVDAAATLAEAMRGARLVLLDGMSGEQAASLLQPGQGVMDLATATAPDIDAVLLALGLPPGTQWRQVRAAVDRDMAHSAANTEMPAVHRGELP
jgi:hypothetical protein